MAHLPYHYHIIVPLLGAYVYRRLPHNESNHIVLNLDFISCDLQINVCMELPPKPEGSPDTCSTESVLRKQYQWGNLEQVPINSGR